MGDFLLDIRPIAARWAAPKATAMAHGIHPLRINDAHSPRGELASGLVPFESRLDQRIQGGQ